MARLDSISGDSRLYYSRHQWQIAGLLLVSYLVVYELAARFLPGAAELHPAAALALTALFFGGLRLWPMVYITALVAALLAGMPAFSLITGPLSVTLQAVAGAYLLRSFDVDPLFRRYRDTFYLIGMTILVSFISPSFESFSYAVHGIPYTILTWGQAYAAAIFCLLIITPFIMRWFAKPRFSRRPLELLETIAVFAVLLGIDYALFIRSIPAVLGVPLVYLLLIPLFLIALRLRPRFVTLALLLTSVFAVIAGIEDTVGTLQVRLFGIESFLIVIAVIFYVIVSQEEDRRVSTNIIHSQLGTLENALARIKNESNAKNDFIAILAHELRNPLSPIVSGIEMMQLKGGYDEEDTALLAMMADRMATVRRLLDDLLDISRISEGKVALKHESVELGAVLERAVLSTEHHRKELHQSLVFRSPETPLSIAGDAVRLEQIFSNLLTNASKYSNQGDVITLQVHEQDRIAEIEVIDEGIGLERHTLEHIFTPFQQIEQGKRTQKGLGIGLALVRSFVDMHRGNVIATSDGPGLGSRFIVRLPLLFDPAPKKNRDPSAPAAARSGSRPRILVVDDNDAAAGSMGRLLSLQGCSVAYAYTGSQAIEQALSLSPDVVLLDLGLPDKDGYAVAKTLRARGYVGRLIALTGYSTEDARASGKEAGFDHYLVKPAGLADLRRVMPELG